MAVGRVHNQVFAKAIPGLVVSDDVLANRRGGGLRHCEITDPAEHPAIIFPDDDHGGPNDPRSRSLKTNVREP